MKKHLLFLLFISFLFAQEGNLIWQKTGSELPDNGYSWSTPLIMDGKIFWVGQGKGMAAMDAETGEVIWSDTTIIYSGTYDSPVGYDGKIFVGRDDWSNDSLSCLVAVDSETGSLLWQRCFTSIVNRISKPIDENTNRIFYATSDTLFCVSTLDGSLVWNRPEKVNNLLLNTNSSSLYVACSDSALVKVLNPATGTLEKRIILPDSDTRAASMAYGIAEDLTEYLITAPANNWSLTDFYMYSINLSSGTINWQSYVAGYVGNKAAPVIMGDKIFVGTQKSSSATTQNIVALNLSDGSLVWETPARGSGATNTPYVVALDGKLFFENSEASSGLPFSIVCADYATGDSLWTSKPAFENAWPLTWGSPLVYQNKVYVAKDGEGIYCFDGGSINGDWLMLGGNIHATNNYFESLVTDVNEFTGQTPEGFSLDQNYPNPFNPQTRISFTIPETGKVSLKVFNILGSEVAELLNETRSAGRHEIEFDAGRLASGLYIYSISVNGWSQSKKMMLLK